MLFTNIHNPFINFLNNKKMKKTLILASMAVLALVSCNKMESPNLAFQDQNELSFIPMAGNNNTATRGYTESTTFYYTPFMGLHTPSACNSLSRDMHISAYQYPQNGIAANYFVDKTFSELKKSDDDLTGIGVWANFDNNKKHTPIYWPIGCTMDFLAYSIVEEEKEGTDKSKPMTGHDHIKVVWDANNAASQVVLDVPGESSQDDILFASASNRLSEKGHQSVAMTFKHAQAWLEFVFIGGNAEHWKDNPTSENPDQGCTERGLSGNIYINKIVLDDVYNAGKLTIDNNLGNAIANWDFSGQTKKDIVVDDNWNYYESTKFMATSEDDPRYGDACYFDMLIPEQPKTSFTIYYQLPGIAEEQSYHFTTDLKTWLMGEKYIYTIKINTHEITVTPTVQQWHDGGVADVDLEGGYAGRY